MAINIPAIIANHTLPPAVPPELVMAIVVVESNGNPWAMRAEPGYRWLWDIRRNCPWRGDAKDIPAPPFVSRATELWGQRTSWGLMQVMGATAREMGFRGPFLSELSDPHIGMEYGLKYLGTLVRRFYAAHGIEGVVAAYNAGSPRRSGGAWENQAYVDKVRRAGGFRACP